MSWLGQENEEYLKPFVEKFVKAHEGAWLAGEKKKEAEEDLLDKMITCELEEIKYGEWRIIVDLPDEGDVSLVMVRRDVLDLS